MTSQPAAGPASTTDDETHDEIVDVRSLLAAADRRLLGDTIAIDDEAWRQPSVLPGWTRAHVATHIARQADGMARLANWARTGIEQPMYTGDRDAEIEAGAARGGLEIQTDLDTSAGRLGEEFDAVNAAAAWDQIVALRNGQQLPAAQLPLGRLAEVVVHHLDLGIGLTVDGIDRCTAEAVLGWCAFRLSTRRDYPSLRLTTDSGRTYDFGPQSADVIAIDGPANLLLGWITRRSGSEGLSGPIPDLPSFG